MDFMFARWYNIRAKIIQIKLKSRVTILSAFLIFTLSLLYHVDSFNCEASAFSFFFIKKKILYSQNKRKTLLIFVAR